MESIKRTARFAGLAYLGIIISGMFAEFFVRSNIIVQGNPAATAENISASQLLFRIGFSSDLMMLVFDVLVAFALFSILKTVNKNLALLAAGFRLVHASVLGANLLNHFFALLLLSGKEFLTVFSAEQINAFASLFLTAHGYGYMIGLVFFAFHCFILGYLLYKSGFIPKVIGVLMIITSVSYFIDSFGHFILADVYHDFSGIVLIPAIIGEFTFTFWLLIKGIKDEKPAVAETV